MLNGNKMDRRYSQVMSGWYGLVCVLATAVASQHSWHQSIQLPFVTNFWGRSSLDAEVNDSYLELFRVIPNYCRNHMPGKSQNESNFSKYSRSKTDLSWFLWIGNHSRHNNQRFFQAYLISDFSIFWLLNNHQAAALVVDTHRPLVGTSHQQWAEACDGRDVWCVPGRPHPNQPKRRRTGCHHGRVAFCLEMDEPQIFEQQTANLCRWIPPKKSTPKNISESSISRDCSKMATKSSAISRISCVSLRPFS